MEISKREVIASIAIVAVMLIIGFFISDKISDWQNDKNAEYQKAIHIENSEMFRYGMDTSVGNAFVYGELKAIDTVTFEEIGEEYLWVEKVEEHYNRHERTVTKKDSNGKEYTEPEVYYEWDVEDRESKHAEQITFLGVKFPYGKISVSGKRYIKTINGGWEWSWKSFENVKVRFRYYGISTEHTGTIYTRLSDGTISDGSRFFEDYTIEQALDSCTSSGGTIIFWICWILLICVSVGGFCYLKNRWLE